MLPFDILKGAQSGMLLLAGSPNADPGMPAWIPAQILCLCHSVLQRSPKGQGGQWATAES